MALLAVPNVGLNGRSKHLSKNGKRRLTANGKNGAEALVPWPNHGIVQTAAR